MMEFQKIRPTFWNSVTFYCILQLIYCKLSIGRTDGCTEFIIGFGGVYWGIDGVGIVKFVI
jgi:hypothetical protein